MAVAVAVAVAVLLLPLLLGLLVLLLVLLVVVMAVVLLCCHVSPPRVSGGGSPAKAPAQPLSPSVTFGRGRD